MSKTSQGKRQRMKQSKKMTHKLFDSMKPGEIISACKSGKWDVKSLILRGEVPILPIAQHFKIDTRKLSTGAIKYAVIDAINETIANTSHKEVL